MFGELTGNRIEDGLETSHPTFPIFIDIFPIELEHKTFRPIGGIHVSFIRIDGNSLGHPTNQHVLIPKAHRFSMQIVGQRPSLIKRRSNNLG